MSKLLSINVKFNTVHQLFNCTEEEFPSRVAQHFNIDISNFDVYAVRKGVKRKIRLQDVCDVMKIEIVPKNGSSECGQRSLRSYFSGEPVGISALKQNIITKLKNNTPLTGIERKALVEHLEEDNSANCNSNKKRKMDDSPVKSVHKKVQVNFHLENRKDSFVQTDSVPALVRHDPDPEEEEEESIPIKLKKLAYKGDADPKEVERLMGLSFDDRRHFIMLKTPLVHVVKDKYPLLFSFKEVKNELDRIFYPGKCVDFVNNMVKYSTHILSSSNSEDEIYILTQKSVAKVHSPQQKAYARTVGSIFLLAKILEEDWRFIHLSDCPHGSSDIYPHIDGSYYSLKQVFYDSYLFPVVVEEERLCEAPNLLEAILCLIATFFIFNVNYPESCRRTLIVFEKLFLCANDTTEIDDMTSQMIKMLELKASNKK